MILCMLGLMQAVQMKMPKQHFDRPSTIPLKYKLMCERQCLLFPTQPKTCIVLVMTKYRKNKSDV
jgi:hypothetical protein